MAVRRDFASALVPAFRRVDGVRVYVGNGCLRAEAYGMGHRWPAHIAIGTALATKLVEAGAPLEVIRVGAGSAGSAETRRVPAASAAASAGAEDR